MTTNKTHVSFRIIYWTTNVTFWLFAVGAAFGTLIGLAILFNIFGNDLNLHVGLPVEFNVLETGTITGSDFVNNANMVEASGKIGFSNIPAHLRVLYGVFMIFVICILFFLFNTFRVFIKNVYKGIIFKKENILLLKRISYGLVVFWGFIVAYTTIQYFVLARHLKFDTIEFTGNLNYYPVILLVALFLWVLSHIFMHGKELEEESNLTI